ncbi:hypothetical protein A1O3_09952 [Capronia epimyces CBS 606.96]|uniref:Putative lipoate-protein ligase A n=1 Tax=Capronia epimyces CBS 606.96 TaxID=1182542 RepID=W9XBW4_9EURO|nr:uncharacterized protein A1O3_09952 [Capronia epimyces CBS 606.96]EXJ77723.1 hypothetical protein A1O3_09952 [Capronia epimyces CBS 606.96]
MRAALSPNLTPSRWIRLRLSHSPTAPLPAYHASRSLTSVRSSHASWKLQDLSRVSQDTTPLVFHSTSDNPYHNLALEHYLLTHLHSDSRVLLFYTNRPCVVIGRNQNPWLETDLRRLREGLLAPQEEAEREEAASETMGSQHHGLPTTDTTRPHSTAISLVRRRSGGGTVFHDSGNLNYSVIVPNSKSFKRSTHAEMVVRALSSAKLKLQLTTVFPHYEGLEVKVNDRNDIVMRHQNDDPSQWLKVSGSAYKLTRGRALHHGTLLYSSPYIDKISELLRSPGRDFIHAKGVESVRSKVANLVWTPDIRQRHEVRTQITEAIIDEFWNMYGAGQTRQPGMNEITIGHLDCAADRNPEVAAGVAELMSDAWRFEQTPRFDFSSGVLDGMSVGFQASHGVLEHLTLKRSDGALLVQKQNDDFGQAVKLSDVKSWRDLVQSGQGPGDSRDQSPAVRPAASIAPRNINVPDSLIRMVEAIFPRWRT